MPQNHRPPIHLRVLAIHIPVDFRSHNLFETMSSNQFQEFNIDELTSFINNNTGGDNLGFDEFNWDSSNVAGQSQPDYTGVGVWGDLNNYPDFPSPTSAPTSLYPTHGVFPSEGKASCILMNIVRRLTFVHRKPLTILPGYGCTLALATTGDHYPHPRLPPLPHCFTRSNPVARL